MVVFLFLLSHIFFLPYCMCLDTRAPLSQAAFVSGMQLFSSGASIHTPRLLIRRAAALRFYSISTSTRTTYSSGQRRFFRFCSLVHAEPFPLVERTLCLWVAHMSYHLALSTISQYLSAVRRLSIDLGFGSPIDQFGELARVRRGLSRFVGSRTARPRLPVTIPILRLFAPLIGASLDEQVSWTVIVCAVFGLFRLSELAPHKRSDASTLMLSSIRFRRRGSRQYMSIFLATSKTDQVGKGHTVLIGASGSGICAYRQMRKYLSLRRRLLGSLHNSHPLFCFSDGSVVLYRDIVLILGALASASHLSALGYSGHSLRKGGAMSLINSHTPDHLIMRLGRWKSTAYLRYLDQPNLDLIQLAARMVRA